MEEGGVESEEGHLIVKLPSWCLVDAEALEPARRTRPSLCIRPGDLLQLEGRRVRLAEPGSPLGFYCLPTTGAGLEEVETLLAGATLRMQAVECRAGVPVMVEWEGGFHRAVPAQLGPDPAYVSCLLVDRGVNAQVAVTSVFALPEEAARLPAVAVRCSLAGVAARPGRDWSEAWARLVWWRPQSSLSQSRIKPDFSTASRTRSVSLPRTVWIWRLASPTWV